LVKEQVRSGFIRFSKIQDGNLMSRRNLLQKLRQHAGAATGGIPSWRERQEDQ
jgi:hypothetical protein